MDKQSNIDQKGKKDENFGLEEHKSAICSRKEQYDHSKDSEIYSGKLLKQEIELINMIEDQQIVLMVFDPKCHKKGIFIKSDPDIPSGRKLQTNFTQKKKIFLEDQNLILESQLNLTRDEEWLEIDAFISQETNAPLEYLIYKSNMLINVCISGQEVTSVQYTKEEFTFNNLFIEVKSLGAESCPVSLQHAISKGILQLFVLYLNSIWYYGKEFEVAGDKLKKYSRTFDNSKSSKFLLHILCYTNLQSEYQEWIQKVCQTLVEDVLTDPNEYFLKFLQDYLYIKLDNSEDNLYLHLQQNGLKKHSSKENWKKILGDIFTDGFKANTAEIMKVSLNQQMNSKIEEKVNSAFKENFKPLKDSLIDICLEYLFPKEDISS